MSINGNSELIVRYDGSKTSFESANGPKNTYIEAKVSKVVFITGSTATNATAEQKRQYIWITDGSSDKYIDMSNVEDIQNSLTHIAGLATNGSFVNIGDGRSGLNFVGANGVNVSQVINRVLDSNGVPYWTIKIDGSPITAAIQDKAAQSDVDGLSERVDQAEGDIDTLQTEQGTQKTAILQQAQDIANLNTRINGVNESVSEANKAIGTIETALENKADLENGRIPTGQLPDYILGQLLFGGTAEFGTEDTLGISPSGNYKQMHNVPGSQERVTIDKDAFDDHEGEYFIAAAGFTAFGIPVNTGDWIVSTGVDWRKIDNTDAITKVAGVVPEDGDIPKAGLITALGVDKKYEKPSNGIPKTDLESGVQTSLDKIDSIDNKVEQTVYDAKVAELEASIGGKYTKPAGGIPEKDLAFKVVTEEEVVNAISKAAADLNDKIDSKVGKTDTIPAEHVGGLSDGANGMASDNSIIANRIPYLKADAFAFLKPEDFTVEVAYDGSTWVTLDSNDPKLLSMFTMKNYTEGFLFDGYTGSWGVESKVRITIAPPTTSPRNSHIDFITVSMFCNMWEYGIESEYYDMRRGAWIKAGSTSIGTYDNIAYIKYGQYFAFNAWSRWGARLTFTVVKPYESYSRILSISGFGSIFNGTTSNVDNAPYTLGTLWDWDYLKNVYFPNDIYEGGTSLKNKYASITAVIQGIESADDDYITISDKGGTAVPTKVIGAKTALISESGKGLATAEDVRASIPKTLPNPNALEIKLNGLPVETYDGSSKYQLSFYAPTKVGSKGQVFKSIDGVMVDWDNVDWSEIKNKPDVINFAKDLTGVLEATPEEFTYRPSAGNKSIRDEGAVIRRIKGNTIVWEQRGRCTEKNFMFEPYGDNAIIQHRQSADIEWSSWLDNSCLEYPQGDKVLVEIIPLNNNYLRDINYLIAFGTTIYINEPKIVTVSRAAISMRCSPESIGFIFIPQIHNLTRMFGAGDEPQTYEEFKAIYPDIYPYCEPEIRNVKTTAIETVGFNLFNGLFAELIGGKTYYVGGSNIGRLMFYPNGYSLSEAVVLDANNTFTPLVSGKLRSSGSDVCVHLQHSGIKDGECADYVKHTLELPEIATYFPNGMNGNANVWDEINSKNAIQRWGVVDLGKLAWRKSGTDASGVNRWHSDDVIVHPIQEADGIPNMVCLKYATGTNRNTYYRIDCISVSEAGYLRIFDSNYTTDADKDAFVASLQGVLLYYELAEPIVKPILEPIQLVYDVEDFGTERAIAPENSAPFRADIVYQFNAEGRIRDNGRNIERLEKNLNGRFDNNFVIANGVVDDDDNYYHLPSKRGDTLKYNLATEQYVEDRISTIELSGDALLPTEIDTTNGNQSYLIQANRVYIFLNKINSCNFKLNVDNTISGKDNKWCFRFQAGQGPYNIHTPDYDWFSPTYKIIWKDNTSPTFEKNSWYEISFTISGPIFLGEYKRYYALQTSIDK